MTDPSSSRTPPPQLLAAMERLRRADPAGALSVLESALADRVGERTPFLALAGLAALRAGLPERAIAPLEELLKTHPADRASRLNLANAYIETGRFDDAMQVAASSEEPAMLRIRGYVHQHSGQYDQAATLYRQAVAAEPGDVASWNNLGSSLAALDRHEEAISPFEHAITLAPREPGAYLNLAESLRLLGRHEAQRKVLTDAAAIAPDDVRVLTELGLAQTALEELGEAEQTLLRAIALGAPFGAAQVELASIYEAESRLADLRALADRYAAENAPEAAYIRAWLALREGRVDDADTFARAIPTTVAPARAAHLRGLIADRLGDADRAFAAFSAMNRAIAADAPAPAGETFREQVERRTTLLAHITPLAMPASRAIDEHADPVFVVGFPRSGTTLIDTMLMGQPGLQILEERPMMARLTTVLGEQTGSPWAIADDQLPALREQYFGHAREFGWDGTRQLVDKHPLNMTRAALIRRLFPKAKLLFVQRHPYDVVLSCYIANFAPNFAMRSFLDLTEAARTYDAVLSCWAEATERLAIPYHTACYETLVTDPEGELRQVIDWLGLSWNERMLDHTSTARERGRVRTASYAQIHEPIYQRASGRWLRYRHHLDQVAQWLDPWVDRLGYAPVRPS